jgi:hypothetical protein
VKNVMLHTSLATVCVDVVFHRNFSSAGWTDQRVLPAQDALHDYWSRIRQLHNLLYGEKMIRQIFTCIGCSAFCRQLTETWQRRKISTTMKTKDCLWQAERGLC